MTGSQGLPSQKDGTQRWGDWMMLCNHKSQRAHVLWPGRCKPMCCGLDNASPCAVAWTMLLAWAFTGPLASSPTPAMTIASFPAAHPHTGTAMVFSLVCLLQELSLSRVSFLANKKLLLWLGLTPLHCWAWAASMVRGLLSMSFRMACACV